MSKRVCILSFFVFLFSFREFSADMTGVYRDSGPVYMLHVGLMLGLGC